MLAAANQKDPQIFEVLTYCEDYKEAFYAKDINGWTAKGYMEEFNQAPNKADLAQIMQAGAVGKPPEEYDVEFKRALSLLKGGNITVEFEALVQSLPVNYDGGNNNTLLHFAAHYANSAAVQLLLENGYGVDIPNKDGQTPLMFAVMGGHCNLIVSMKDKPEFGRAINQSDSNGFTPLKYACSYGEHGVEIRQQMIVQLFDYARQKEVDIINVNFRFPESLGGNTLLEYVALELSNQQLLNTLLANPTLDIRTQDVRGGQNVVMKAAAYGNLKLVEALSQKTGFDQSMVAADRNGWSAIHYTTLCFSGEDKQAETLENRQQIAGLLLGRFSGLKTFTVNDGRTAAQLVQNESELELKRVLS